MVNKKVTVNSDVPKREMTDRELKIREIEALEKIGTNLENIFEWLDDIDKEEWGDRIQWYLGLYKQAILDPKLKPSE